MWDAQNRAEPCRALAEECRRLAATARSSQVKNRYLLMAGDYTRLADLKEQAHAYRPPATVEEDAAWAATMTSRFSAPWQIVEIPNGFAVNDATGQQLAAFYGLAEPNTARQSDLLTIDEARQMASDFAKLPAVAGLRLPEIRTAAAKSTSFEPDEWMPGELLPGPKAPLSHQTKFSNRTKFLMAAAVAALPAGYFLFRNFDRPVDVAVVSQATTDIPPVELSSAQEAERPSTEATGSAVESRAEPRVQTAPLPVPSETKPTNRDTQARPPQTLRERERQSFAAGRDDQERGRQSFAASRDDPERGRQSFAASRDDPERGRQSSAASRDDSTCLPSAAAVRQNYPGAWPSWTLRAPGHENTRCWYAAARTTARRHD